MREENDQRRGEQRIHQTIRGAQDRLLAHKQQLESIVAQDQDRLRELAEEIKQGKDELYNDNAAKIDTLYEESKAAQEIQLNAQKEFAIKEQEVRNNMLVKMKLEEQIEEQDERKMKLQQKSMRARQQIARTIRKTQTFIVDQEKLLKEKLLTVKIMNHDIMKLNKQHGIISAKKREAQSAYLDAEA